jgi:hypothetical protein
MEDQDMANKRFMAIDTRKLLREIHLMSCKLATHYDAADKDAQIKKVTAERDQAIAKANQAEAGRHIALAALSAGVTPEALPDLMLRAAASGWTNDDCGEPMLLDKGKSSPVPSPRNFNALTLGEWITNLKKTAPHFFGGQPNCASQGNGAGSQGSNGGGYELSRNPWARSTWDDMRQVAIYRTDPTRAKALAEAAGSHIGARRPA